ncbi:MAG TPA: hypothetical protein VM240_12440 [Verrucomicrobiae bacterium]|nr:hypothetical protein [Verrucomicrobiae bacterium]
MDADTKLNVYMLGRTGTGLVIMPGGALLIGGLQPFLGGLVIGALLLVASLDIRLFLRESAWYRLYLFTLFSAWTLLGLVGQLYPSALALVGLATIAITVIALFLAIPRLQALTDGGRDSWKKESPT